MAPEADYSHRTAVQKLGAKEGERLEVGGDVGTALRRELREVVGRGFVKSGEVDGAIVLVNSHEEAEQAFDRLQTRLRDSGYLWLVTWKRGHDRYLNQMHLVPAGKRRGLIDNKTCSIDHQRSGIRFVIPRARRQSSNGASA